MDTTLIIATLVSLTLGTVMAVIAWRLLRQNNERRAARVEALQALSGAAAEEPVPELFAQPEHLPAGRWLKRLGAVAAIAACGVLPYAMYSMGVFEAIASAAPSAGGRPIELLSLRHAADDVGGFTVTGLVQNPLGGRKTKDVIAVVYLFDDGGRILATGRAPLDVSTFQPGEESTFVVVIPKAKGVGKYRVGFRLADGGVVAHIDRRGEPPVGTSEDAVGPDRASPVHGPLAPSGREGE